jgi:hypothetical protein
MTDFVAILKKTIDGQSVNSADLRARVYARARQTIEQKLNSLTPAPSAEQKTRQMKALDDAIETVEQAYAPAAEPSPVNDVKQLDPLEAFISAAEADNKRPPVPVEPVIAVSVPRASANATPVTNASATLDLPYARQMDRPELIPSPKPVSPPRSAKRGGGNLLWAALGVLLAAGASYGAYLKRDEIAVAYRSFTVPAAPEVKKVVTTSVKPADPAAAPVKTEPAAPAVPAKVAPGEEKFTQRLTEDGKEVESGPAVTAAAVGEGETVAQVTTPAAAKPAAADAATPAVPAAPAAPDTPAVPASVPVGQKAVFYEEKTGTAEGTVDTGAVVWSMVQDSPGADQPAEAAIRGEVNIPDKGIQLKLTIKRNGDKTLPASHIIELAFTVPDGFEGGSIDGVQRVTFKDTEQAPGNPLVGVPANFGDGFFLIALTDEKSAVENNLALMSRQSWIDIPLTYKSGRRALISIEKGIPGDKVFQEVFKAWAAKAAG